MQHVGEGHNRHVSSLAHDPGLSELDEMLGTAVMAGTMVTTVPQIKAGRLRGLGITTTERSNAAPDIPTVAEAGLPKGVVRQARARLAELEAQNRDAPTTQMTAQALDAPLQIGLFASNSAVSEALAALEPDELTPKQALEALYRLMALG